MTDTRILLIEDDEDDYEFTRELLAGLPGAGLELSWVSDYHKGIEASRSGQLRRLPGGLPAGRRERPRSVARAGGQRGSDAGDPAHGP